MYNAASLESISHLLEQQTHIAFVVVGPLEDLILLRTDAQTQRENIKVG